jgi:hypothetical protein
VIGVAGEFGRFPMKRVARQADDSEQPRQPFLCPLLGPIESGALRVGIDEGDAAAVASSLARQMKRERGLADAALLVEERDDHDAPPGLATNGRVGAAAWTGGRSLPSR